MEDVAAYQQYIDRIRRIIERVRAKREAKLQRRRNRNLKNKANGGFGGLHNRDVQAGQSSN